MVSAESVSWCAGVIDALGLVRTRVTDTGSVLAYVGVSSPNMPVLERLATVTGTSVTVVRRDYFRAGCADHCTEAHQHVRSVTGRWSLTGARAAVFLEAIEPELCSVREIVRGVLEECRDAPTKPGTVKKMQALGWPVRESST